MTITEKETSAPAQYSAGVVKLGNIALPATSQAEAIPDITDTDGSTAHVTQKSFADFGVSEPIVRALADQGITHPFPIQALTLPVALDGHDIIGQAKTGTGKTLGFGIPLLEEVLPLDAPEYQRQLTPGIPQALVILPTRELTKQVAQDISQMAKHLSVRVVEIYGGVAFDPQVNALKKGAEVVVGTPGRLIDLMKRGILKLNGVKVAVLDEADEMLDLGFLPDVETLLSRVPVTRHTMLFSATMPGAVVALARRFMSHPTHIRAQDPADQNTTVNAVKQVIYRVHAMNKEEVVARILQANGRGRTMIFCRTKRTAARLSEDLGKRGFAVGALHGDLGQGAREQAMRAFRHGKIDVLVATDVAARGIDVDDVTHVINYQCPEDEKHYIHRIGRTGRAGHSGTAVTFVDWDDVPRWSLISQALGLGVPEPLETYHTSPHLFTDLDIPEGTGPRLPKDQRTREGLRGEKLEDLGETGTRTRGGRGAPSAGRGRVRTRTRARQHRAREQHAAAGQHGRSDRGSRGRGRGDHTAEPRQMTEEKGQTPRRQRQRRRRGHGSASAEG